MQLLIVTFKVLDCDDQTVVAEFEPVEIKTSQFELTAAFVNGWDQTKFNVLNLSSSKIVLRAQHSEPQDWQLENNGIKISISPHYSGILGLVHQCAFDQHYTKFRVKSETTAELNGVYTLIDPTDKLQGLKKENSDITMTLKVISSIETMQVFQDSTLGTIFARRVLKDCATDVATTW